MRWQMPQPNLAAGKVRVFLDYINSQLDEINENISAYFDHQIKTEETEIDYRVACEKRFQLSTLARVFYDLMYKEIYPNESFEVQEVKHVIYGVRQHLEDQLKSRDKILYDQTITENEKKEKLKHINRYIKQVRRALDRNQKHLSELWKKEET